MFFAFAGYARIATLAEEVRDPARVIPRAILIALAIALASMPLSLSRLWPRSDRIGSPCRRPRWSDAVRAAGVGWLVPVVGAGAAVAALGSLLALILGVSRTALAMARDRHLPPRWPPCTRASRCRTAPN